MFQPRSQRLDAHRAPCPQLEGVEGVACLALASGHDFDPRLQATHERLSFPLRPADRGADRCLGRRPLAMLGPDCRPEVVQAVEQVARAVRPQQPAHVVGDAPGFVGDHLKDANLEVLEGRLEHLVPGVSIARRGALLAEDEARGGVHRDEDHEALPRLVEQRGSARGEAMVRPRRRSVSSPQEPIAPTTRACVRRWVDSEQAIQSDRPATRKNMRRVAAPAPSITPKTTIAARAVRWSARAPSGLSAKAEPRRLGTAPLAAAPPPERASWDVLRPCLPLPWTMPRLARPRRRVRSASADGSIDEGVATRA